MAKGKGVLLNKKLSSFHNILYWIKIYTDLHTAFFFGFVYYLLMIIWIKSHLLIKKCLHF